MKQHAFVGRFVALALAPVALLSCTTRNMDSGSPSAATTQAVEQKVAQQVAFYIGQHYGGGIIFWIDATGKHGLIAAKSDQGFTWWGDRTYIVTGATDTAVGTGWANTKKIITAQGRRYSYAALLCADYRGGRYADWFQPSKDELYLLYQQKDVVGGFVRGSYWSSSEFDHSLAWTKFFYNDNAVCSHKDRYDGVRAIRAF